MTEILLIDTDRISGCIVKYHWALSGIVLVISTDSLN